MKIVSGLQVLCLGLILYAAGFASASDQDLRKITFTVFGEPGGDWSDIFFSGEGEGFEPVQFNPYGRSETFVATIGREIHFHRRVQFLDAEEGSIYSSIGSVSVPADASELLFLFILDPLHRRASGELEAVSIFAVNDERHVIPVDHLTLFNATGRPLQGSINRSPVRVERGQNKPMKIDPTLAVGLEFSIWHNNALHPVLINQLRISFSRRTVLLLLPPRSPGSLRIRAVRISEAVPGGATSTE